MRHPFACHERRRKCGRKRTRKPHRYPDASALKSVLGFRQFSLRGLERVRAEWKLVCAALNLRRMATLIPA